MGLIPQNDPVSGTVLGLLCISLNVSILNTLLIIVFTSRNRQKWLILFSGGAVGLSFITNWILIPHYAQAGAAWATLLSQCVLFAAMAYTARRIFHLRFPFAKPLGILSVCLFSGGVLWMIPGIPLWAIPFLYALLLFGSARVSGVLTREEIQAIVRKVRG